MSAISQDTVAVLLEDQYPDLAHLPVERIEEEGTDNAIFRLGKWLCARFPRVQWARLSARRELAILRKLDDLPLETPRPFGLGAPGCGYDWNWSILGWVEGTPLSGGALPMRDAERLAQFILALRARPFDTGDLSGPSNSFRGVPLGHRDRAVEHALGQLHDICDTHVLAGIWQAAREAAATDRPVWLHGDLHGGNVIVRDGALAGIIDWGLAGAGDGTCDLAAAWNLFEADGRAAFRAAMAATEGEWLRGAGWALSIAVIFFAHYRDKGVPVDGSQRTLARLLQDFA